MKLSALSLGLFASAAVAASSVSPTKVATASIASHCSIGSDATATAQTDLDKLSSCETVVGNLTVTGSLGNGALANVKKIDGSLSIFNATSLGTFAADSLQEITGTLEMRSLTILTSASFGSLAKVDTINFITLPALSQFTTNLRSANNILISDTSLESIEAFTVLNKVNVLNVNNNRNLANISSSVRTVSDSLQFSYNGKNAALNFDKLVWANNITLSDVDSVSFKSLSAVNASLGFINNSMTSIECKNLSSIGGSFSVISNDQLTKLSFDKLAAIGGAMVVANNSALQQIDGFKKVATVGGAMVFTGEFSSLPLDSLKSVRGGANFESTSSNFSCDPLKRLQSKGAIQGDSFVCKNGAKSTSVELSSATRSSSTQSASATGSSSSSESGSSRTTVTSSSRSQTSTASVSNDKKANNAVNSIIPGTTLFGTVAAIALALL